MRIKTKNIVFGFFIIVMITGCATSPAIPLYQQPTTGDVAKISLQVPFGNDPRFYIYDHGIQKQVNNEQFYGFNVPSDVTTTFYLHDAESIDGMFPDSCKMVDSFIPQKNNRYMIKYSEDRDKCHINIYRVEEKDLGTTIQNTFYPVRMVPLKVQ
jgi:hypothetical protein